MDSQRRLLLAMVLSAVVILAAQLFFGPPTATHGLADGGVVEAVDAGGPAAVPAPSPGAALPAAATTPGAAAPVVHPREVAVDRDLVHYVFSNAGGGLVRAELVGPKMREQRELSWGEAVQVLLGKKREQAPQMDMAVPVVGDPLPLSVSVAGEKPFAASTPMEMQEDLDHHQLTFHGVGNGWEVTKRFSWESAGFELGYQVTVKNVSGEPRRAELAVHTVRAIVEAREEAPSMFGGVGNQAQVGCAYGDEYKHVLPLNKPPESFQGPISFFGVDQQYFLTAVFPLGGARPGRCVLTATSTERTSTGYFPLDLAPGQSTTQSFGVFMGPKDTDLLSAVPSGALHALGAGLAATGSASVLETPHLERAVDYGWWTVICKLLLAVLKLCHRLVGNWGVAIILLTVVVRLLMTPFNHRMMVGQLAMQKLQPKIEAMKKKYPDDRERQQMEMMKLYQEAGVNPFGSCLLLFIQMPIWIALYRALRNSYEIYREPFFGAVWQDLTFKDPTYFVPLLLGISQIITTRLQPQTMDPSQAKVMNWVMPIVFTAFLFNYPLGLTLYIFTSNVLGVAQQYVSRRLIARAQPAAS